MNRNFLKKNEGVGGHSGKFRKVPWYFFVIPFVKEVGGWLFSEISKSQHMFHQKSTCTPPPPPPPPPAVGSDYLMCDSVILS